MTTDFLQAATDYRRVAQAIQFIEDNLQNQPDLKTIADHVGLSEHHFQRLFRRWAGVSPKRFLQFLTLEYAKGLLSNGRPSMGGQSLLEVTYESGLSSPGRLHDLFITYEAMTPGEYKRQGAGLTIAYGFHTTPFGEALLAMTDRGICGLYFVQAGNRTQALAAMQANWPRANFQEESAQTEPVVEQIFDSTDPAERQPPSLKLLLRGTPFQVKVWEALLRVPGGRLVSYNDIAAQIGQPTAARAVGNAVGRNPIGYLIPCHRVIRKVGQIGPYRWGSTRKKAIIGWEAAQAA